MNERAGRILVVDDEREIRDLLRDFLARKAYDVLVVSTGEEALEAVPAFRPDVVLVDMVLPGLSGADVLIALRRAGSTVPVILITGTEIAAGEAYFGVLRKPFRLRTMAELVAAAVSGVRPHGTAEPA
jgi:DNA-binding response OmpR family regulator